MTVTEPKQWSTRAVNLPDHASNVIHTDEGARAAGFERALVSGTTIYAYMTHPAVEAWGDSWLGVGGGELRLRKPVFEDDLVDCTIERVEGSDGNITIQAQVGGEVRATLDVWHDTAAPKVRDGETLTPVEVELGQEHLDYGVRAGDDLGVYVEKRLAHPVIWANLANAVFKDNLVTGPWVHVRSRIYHEGLAHIGASIRVEPVLLKRFASRAGERALVDMRIYADGKPVATIEHEAIIVLA